MHQKSEALGKCHYVKPDMGQTMAGEPNVARKTILKRWENFNDLTKTSHILLKKKTS